MRKLKLGIIGTGIATNDLYWPELKKLRGKIEIVAVANRRKAKARAFARKAGVKVVCDSGEELLARPDVEAVVLSLPIELNATWVIKALKAGKHVLCEKPLARDSSEGRRLIRAASKFRKHWLVGENYFFVPHIQAAKQWVREGRLGKVRFVECTQLSWTTPDNKYFKTKWRQHPKYVGGFVVDGGVHIANVCRELFGMPQAFKGYHAQFHPLLHPVDTALSVMKFKNGALGVWKSCFTAMSRVEPPMLRAYGSKANLEIYRDRSALMPARSRGLTALSKHNGFHHEFEHFYDVVVNRKKLAFSPEQALADLEFTEALLK